MGGHGRKKRRVSAGIVLVIKQWRCGLSFGIWRRRILGQVANIAKPTAQSQRFPSKHTSFTYSVISAGKQQRLAEEQTHTAAPTGDVKTSRVVTKVSIV